MTCALFGQSYPWHRSHGKERHVKATIEGDIIVEAEEAPAVTGSSAATAGALVGHPSDPCWGWALASRVLSWREAGAGPQHDDVDLTDRRHATAHGPVRTHRVTY